MPNFIYFVLQTPENHGESEYKRQAELTPLPNGGPLWEVVDSCVFQLASLTMLKAPISKRARTSGARFEIASSGRSMSGYCAQPVAAQMPMALAPGLSRAVTLYLQQPVNAHVANIPQSCMIKMSHPDLNRAGA